MQVQSLQKVVLMLLTTLWPTEYPAKELLYMCHWEGYSGCLHFMQVSASSLNLSVRLVVSNRKLLFSGIITLISYREKLVILVSIQK